MIETVTASVLFCWGTGDLPLEPTVGINSTRPFRVRTMFIACRFHCQGGLFLLWRLVRFLFLTSLASGLYLGRSCQLLSR